MFDNIEKNKLKLIFFWKYFFQLIIFPLWMSLIIDLLMFIVEWIIRGWSMAVAFMNGYETIIAISVPVWLLCFIAWSLFFILLNCLSILPFFKLLIDMFVKKDVITKEIEVKKLFFPYELQCIRQSKRFICDTFSRKTNVEIFIYDKNKKKYRFFWNEKYSTNVKNAMDELFVAKRMKISYLKYSKIVVDCEIIERTECPTNDFV